MYGLIYQVKAWLGKVTPAKVCLGWLKTHTHAFSVSPFTIGYPCCLPPHLGHGRMPCVCSNFVASPFLWKFPSALVSESNTGGPASEGLAESFFSSSLMYQEAVFVHGSWPTLTPLYSLPSLWPGLLWLVSLSDLCQCSVFQDWVTYLIWDPGQPFCY